MAVGTEPQRWLMEQIVGDRYCVVALLPANTDPENFDPTIGLLKKVALSEGYFKLGHNGFEDNVIGRFGGRLRVVDCSEGVELVYGTHDHGGNGDGDHRHGHRDGEMADPHLLSSVRNARIMARNMARGISEIDPEGRAFYEANLTRLNERLDSIDGEMRRVLEGGGDRSFIVWHPSLTYLARDYGLEQVALEKEGKEMTPAALAATLRKGSEAGARVMFVQPDDETARSQQIGRSAGLELVAVNTTAYDWLLQLPGVGRALRRN